MARDPNFSNTLSRLRRELKYQIYLERRIAGSQTPVCPICGKGFMNNAPDMHEVFITKGHVQGCSDQIKLEINCRENVVLIHPEDCHIKAQHTEEGKLLCAKQIIFYEGYQNILEFFKKMDGLTKIVDRQKYNILEVANGQTKSAE